MTWLLLIAYNIHNLDLLLLELIKTKHKLLLMRDKKHFPKVNEVALKM